MIRSAENGGDEKPGWCSQLVAAISFIPFFGTPIAIGVVGYALGRRTAAWTRLAFVAGCGSFIVSVAAAMFMMGSVGPMRFLERVGMEFSETQLRSLVQSVEYFRLVYERYPASLRDLEERMGGAAGLFPATIESVHYELSRDGSLYTLRFLGRDGQIMTADDILPILSSEEMRRVGYRRSID
jgi:hypothetical protein